MTHYVLATQREWGVKVFEQVAAAGGGHWILIDDCAKEYHAAEFAAAIAVHAPRFAFFVNWSSIVPADVLVLTESVNFHAFGPGPIWHRGGGPIEGLILRGYTETMIWAHRMTAELDAGPVYGSRGPVSLAGTKAQILERFIDPVVSLVREIVETEPEPTPQVGEVVTFKRLPKAEYEKFWMERA